MLAILLLATLLRYAATINRFHTPRENIWVTFANKTDQSSICLSLGSVRNPFKTCLVGLPVWNAGEFQGLMDNNNLTYESTLQGNCTGAKPGLHPAQHDGCWQCQIILSLNTTLASPPEELGLFGSANASMSDASQNGWVSFMPLRHEDLNRPSGRWATVDSSLESGKVHNQLYTDCNATNITQPMKLPEEIFLICGDRAWNGIPVRPQGGPCYLGKLTMFHPNVTTLMQLAGNSGSGKSKRSLHELDCADVGTPAFWSDLKRVIVSTILPGAATSRALNLAKEMGCWEKGEINMTSQVLDMLAQGVQSVNHAVLQNRAAIDFLLLAHGHGCEEFEGMCCMNLSDHSKSIHSKIKEIQNGLHNLREEDSPGLDGWLKGLGLGAWVLTLMKYAIGLLIAVLLALSIIPCILSCIRNLIRKLISQMWHTNLLAQKENGGSVDSVIQA